MRWLVALLLLLLSGCCGEPVGVLEWESSGIWTTALPDAEAMPMRDASRLAWTRPDLDAKFGDAYRATHVSWHREGSDLSVGWQGQARYIGPPGPNLDAIRAAMDDLLGPDDPATQELLDRIQAARPAPDQEGIMVRVFCCQDLDLTRFDEPASWHQGHGTITDGWTLHLETDTLVLGIGGLELFVHGDWGVARMPGAERQDMTNVLTAAGFQVSKDATFYQDGGIC